MLTTEVKINIPEGYEIDRDNSTFECIKFKPKKLTYDIVAKELFHDSSYKYCINDDGAIRCCTKDFTKPNRATSVIQLERLLALNKLINVAKFFNGEDYKPNWEKIDEYKIVILVNPLDYKITLGYASKYSVFPVIFKSKEAAQKAIDILGEDTIRAALHPNY